MDRKPHVTRVADTARPLIGGGGGRGNPLETCKPHKPRAQVAEMQREEAEYEAESRPTRLQRLRAGIGAVRSGIADEIV